MKLLDRVRETMRRRHMAERTEQAYVSWIVRYIRFHKLRHPADMGQEEITEFLSWLATDRKVSASTQNQALNAIAFLYLKVLGQEIGDIEAIRARRTRRLPVVLSPEEVARVLAHLDGQPSLAAQLMYGCGLRVAEACEIRVQNLDLDRGQVVVRSGKGDRDRVVMLPRAARPQLEAQLQRRRHVHERDLAEGGGNAPVPAAYARKSPTAPTSLGWQFLFMARAPIPDPERGGAVFRPPIHRTTVQRAIKQAGHNALLQKRITSHSLRHSFATHLLESGVDIRTVQKLLGHRSVQTTMIYLHVAEQNFPGITSPLDRIRSPTPPRTT